MWAEWVRDTRLPGAWERRLDTPAGRVVRALAAPVQPLVWRAAGTPRERIGYAPGPLLWARRREQARWHRPLRLCLLEGPAVGQRFSPFTAHWINERSQVAHAVVDDVRGADVVWVHTQDPIAPRVRAWLQDVVADVGPDVPVLNPLAAYDAYHQPETFARLRVAGVPVPDPEPAVGDLVVLKAPGQASAVSLGPYDGRLPPGWRAFGAVDARDDDGLCRRYRAYSWLGIVHAGDVIASRLWKAGLATLVAHEPTFVLTAPEEAAVRQLGEVLGLDWFAVDLVRRAGDGAPCITDINVYPTPFIAPFVDERLGCRGRWHVLDTCARLGLQEAQGPFWPRFDAALAALGDRVSGPVPARPRRVCR